MGYSMLALAASAAAILCVIGYVHGFPDGAPSIACEKMVPGHTPSHDDGKNPFVLTLSATSYKPGDNVTGVLSANDSRPFKGFLIQVSKTIDKVVPIGSFVNLDTTKMKTVCGEAGNSGITHTDSKEKTRIAFTWQAPVGNRRDLVLPSHGCRILWPDRGKQILAGYKCEIGAAERLRASLRMSSKEKN